MKIATPGAEGWDLLSHWRQVKDADNAWFHTCAYAGRRLTSVLRDGGLTVLCRFRCGVVGGRWGPVIPVFLMEVVYFPFPHGIGWVGFYGRRSSPTYEFGEAPLVCTLAANCDPPPLCPAFERDLRKFAGALDAHGHWGVTYPPRVGPMGGRGKVEEGAHLGLVLHPRTALRLHAHHKELESWAAQAGRWVLAWSRGEPGPLKRYQPPPGAYDFRPDPAPEEFYTPAAVESLALWNELLCGLGGREAGKVIRSRMGHVATGRKRKEASDRRKMTTEGQTHGGESV